jgi:hypothetical protein
MTQLLYECHSTKNHLSMVKRHKRLCEQIPGAEELIIAVDPFYDDLLKKAHSNSNSRGEQRSCLR